MRDNSLALHLTKQGHEVTVLPTYLPHLLDETSAVKNSPIFFGGVNVYLQHKFRLFRKTPYWVDRLLNSKALLRWAANRSGMTSPRDLGEITLSTFGGKNGPIAKEVEKVIDWFKQLGKPDVLLLSTVLLASVGRAVREELDIPVLSFLQGEDGFLDTLLPHFQEEAWKLLSRDVKTLDGCISPSHFFAVRMGRRLGISPESIFRLPNGISMDGYPRDCPDSSKSTKPTLGYLARICPEKGLDLLVDAFIKLKETGNYPLLKLAVAGTLPRDNVSFLKDLKRKISEAGFIECFAVQTNISREEKIDFLSKLSLFCVPTRTPEAFGLYVIEALALGVPVLLPNHGSFSELIKETQGGKLYDLTEEDALCNALTARLDDLESTKSFGKKGRAVVRRSYSNEKLANQLVKNILAPLASSK